jgi:hypothetical protein
VELCPLMESMPMGLYFSSVGKCNFDVIVHLRSLESRQAEPIHAILSSLQMTPSCTCRIIVQEHCLSSESVQMEH